MRKWKQKITQRRLASRAPVCTLSTSRHSPVNYRERQRHRNASVPRLRLLKQTPGSASHPTNKQHRRVWSDAKTEESDQEACLQDDTKLRGRLKRPSAVVRLCIRHNMSANHFRFLWHVSCTHKPSWRERRPCQLLLTSTNYTGASALGIWNKNCNF